jgi:hypothetical protein
MNRERLMADAKALALERVRARGINRRPPRLAIPVGGENVLAALKLGVHLAWRAGRLGDHDKVVGTALARILAGGSLSASDRRSANSTLLESRARGLSEAVRRAEDVGADSVHVENGEAPAQLMHIIDTGTACRCMIPGIQGRWEYMRPAIERSKDRFESSRLRSPASARAAVGSIVRVASTTSSIRSTRSSISAA